MNFSKEGAKSKKVHQLEPRIQNHYLYIFIRTVQPLKELLVAKK